ncbi:MULTISPECIES: ABC transporter substrate-binding protein [Roseovarius]|uniref:taurine ABC transporter substrate-binding protein n=1 Tax=Roseovarius TaxID=74030 RepID=UPI000C3525B4|nr:MULTISPECIES: ABC transporter substrate-binding protein [Roseovarius]MAZ22762.1 taurine ABC transporter substrate-binding protein [Roseovarius sp.]MBU2999651.1 ABC transporter substrate-binding protein [Roseovarius nubinhibens]
MKKLMSALVAGTALTLSMQATTAQAMEELTVGYFLEWPMPFLAAKADGSYDEALGMKVNWVSFETGTAMSAAMASGDVQISVSQGLPPFVVATSGGQDLQLVDVAVSYAENQGCAVRKDLEITKDSAGELAGKKVAVPLGTAAHYSFIRQMDHFGVPLDSLQIVDMPPPEGGNALAQGAVDFACGYGGGWATMREHGDVLLTGAEKQEIGILVFDVTSVPAAFAAENGDTLAKFLKVTADANSAWNDGKSDEMLAVIAEQSGMDLEAARSAIGTMSFPTIEEQLSEAWLGGTAAGFMKGVADVFVEAGSIDSALDSYEGALNVEPLKAAQGM